VEAIGSGEGLVDVNSWTQIEEFDYKSGEDFLNAPLISDFLMKGWLGSLARTIRSVSRRRLRT